MSISGAEEEPQPLHAKKLKLSSPSSSPGGLWSFPDEIVMSCLCRVSRLDHASLSLVSKWHRSVLLSRDLYYFRSLMGFTENINYLCLRIPPDLNPRWFTLSTKTLNRPRRLVPIRSYLYQPPELSSVVALGHGIYVLGGRIGGWPSSSVLFLDCRSHKWSILPPMGVARISAAAGVIDGKIYVLGGCEDEHTPKWGEVFDPKTQTWDALPMPPDHDTQIVTIMYESAVIEEKVFAVNMIGRCLFYLPSESRWKLGNMDQMKDKRGWYVIENVMYCVSKEGILWCEPGELEWCKSEVIGWREVMGLETLWVHISHSASKLVNYGGIMSQVWELIQPGQKPLDDILPGFKLSNSGPNILLFWDVLGPDKLEIWCAEISLEKRKERGEIWGNIEWFEAVMTLDPPPPHQHHCKILHSLSLNL